MGGVPDEVRGHIEVGKVIRRMVGQDGYWMVQWTWDKKNLCGGSLNFETKVSAKKLPSKAGKLTLQLSVLAVMLEDPCWVVYNYR